MKTVFTTGQVAKSCKVAPRTVAKWADSGRLKHYRIPLSKDRRITRENLIQFLKEEGMPLGELETEQQHGILLVGVNEQLAARLKKSLPLEDGYRYASAESTFHAGTLVAEFKPNCIVIDMSIGRYESVQAVKHLRQQERYTDTHIVALCGDDTTATDAEALIEAGFSDVFRSPIDAMILAKCIAASKPTN